jgi:hypothetical protein
MVYLQYALFWVFRGLIKPYKDWCMFHILAF